ncbi:MAG: FKBP-type peptidyl-prolyl cis-trans isomerase [Candidatus Baldrarchaeia archaeon]|nr:peptidylprolyl isomerase [Candidatus Odinarchaeota archaeon]
MAESEAEVKDIIREGDFVIVDYVARVEETGEIVDLTLEDVAKKEKIYREDGIYKPKLVIVGEGWFIKGFEEGLIGLEVGKKAEIRVPPEKGFGERDPKKIKVVPLREFRKSGVTPRPGMRVTINGKVGTIRTVTSGRVRVDFNHPLAGKTIIYEVYVRKKLTDDLEKIKAIIGRRLRGVDEEKFEVKIENSKVRIHMPNEVFLLENIQYAKLGIASDIHKHFPQINSVVFVEEIIRKEESSAT